LAQAPTAKPSTAAGEWPQFLGPHRNGLSSETGLLDVRADRRPEVLWRVPGGVGMSGLAVSDGRVLTMVQRQGKQRLIALSATTGESLWQTEIANDYRNAMGDGPRATPAIHNGKAFVFTGEGVLAAVDVRDGKLLWSHTTVKDLSGMEAEYGMASSPLVVGTNVIVTVGAPQATLAAYDIGSGNLRWKAGSDPAGYSSPALRNLGGRSQIVVFSGNSALGAAPDSGEVLWRFPYVTNYDCNIAVPLEYQGQILLSAGENHGSVLLALQPKSGRFELMPVWESFGPESVLRSEWQTPLLVDGFLYGMDNVGGAGPVTHLTCVNIANGQRMWQQPRFGKGNLIAADGKLFISLMTGELVVARAASERYEELLRMKVLGSTRQAPSLAGGLLYLRDDKEIVCLDFRSGERRP
jgi:outer membrane protein assembly factor BamB